MNNASALACCTLLAWLTGCGEDSPDGADQNSPSQPVEATAKSEKQVVADVDHEGGSTTVVRVDDKVTVKQIVTAINKTGFKASEPTEG